MSKYSAIADEIKEEIKAGRYSPEGKISTEHELSARYGVSRQTIRQAIQSLKNEGIVYQKQGSGTFVSKVRTTKAKDGRTQRNILVVCTYISDYIFPSIVRGIESVLSPSGFHMSLAATGNKVDTERQILSRIVESGEIDGLIVEGTKTGLPNPNIRLYEEIGEMGIPIVFLHCSYPELPDAVVCGMDDYAGGKDAAVRLVRKGCRKVGAFFKSDDRQGLLRYAGFIDGILESGLSLDGTEVRWFTTEDYRGKDFAIREDQLRALEEAGIDGIVCYNDQVASAFIRTSLKSGYPLIPLISFDDSYLCRNSLTPYFSEGHRKEELGRLSADKIISMINGGEEKTTLMEWKNANDDDSSV